MDRVQEQVLATVRTAPAEELRRVSVGRMPGSGLPPTPGLRAVMGRLDEIAERLTAIENLLAEMRDPAARPARKPASGGARKPPAGRRGPAGGARRKPPAGGAPPGQPEPPAAEA